MLLPKFKLEEYFSKYEFEVPYMMGSSDPESHSLAELLEMADKECLNFWDNLKLSYTESHGLPLLRKEIAKLYDTKDENNVLVCSGAEEAICIAMWTLLKPGDEVVVLTPCYQSLKEIPKSIGAKVIEFDLEWKNGLWTFNLEKFKSTITDNTKLVIINFPHNPTGFHPSQSLFKSIIDIVRQSGAYLFSDEVYRLSEFNRTDRLPNAVDCYDNALSLGVMSKTFGLPGLRIGWLVSNNKSLISELASYKNYTTICNSAPSEILSLMALRNKEKIINRNLSIAKKNLDLLDSFFSQYEEIFDWYRPVAGFINFPRLKANIDINQYAEKLIAEEGVLLLPGTLFDNSNNHFRLGFGRLNLPEALERVDRFTSKLFQHVS